MNNTKQIAYCHCGNVLIGLWYVRHRTCKQCWSDIMTGKLDMSPGKEPQKNWRSRR